MLIGISESEENVCKQKECSVTEISLLAGLDSLRESRKDTLSFIDVVHIPVSVT